MRMNTFLVGMLLFVAAVKAQNDYCTIVLSDTLQVYNISNLTMAAFLPLGAGDVVGVDISGNDLPNMPIYFPNTTSVGPACRDACRQNGDCKYYAYDICADGNWACWLKFDMSVPFEHGCRAYGAMTSTVPVDAGGGNYTMNLCHTTSCGTIQRCQLCQNIGSPAAQYCTGNDAGAVYSQLSAPYTGTGYDMAFFGETNACPGNKRRFSTVHVLCNQPVNKFVFLNEDIVCEYEYEAHLTSNCSFIAPTPTLTFGSQSAATVKVTIVPDSHLYNLDYPLVIQYTIFLNGNSIYTGSTTTLIIELPAQPFYLFTVQGSYNNRLSPMSSVYNVTATTNTIPGEQVIEDMLSVLKDQVTAQGNDIQRQINDVSTRLTVDVVQTLRHADDGTVDIKSQISYINNQTLLNIQRSQTTLQTTVTGVQSTVNNLDGRLSSAVMNGISSQLTGIQGTVNGLDGRLSSAVVNDISTQLSGIVTKTNALQGSLDTLTQQLNQTSIKVDFLIQQVNQTAIKGGSTSSGGSSSGGMIAIGIVIGLVVGVIGALFGNRVFSRAANGQRFSRPNALMNPNMGGSLVDDDDTN